MDRSHAREIVANWMFPTVKSSYMGGAEDRPIIAKSEGSTFTDTDGKTYLDFQSGQMGAALGHQHPRIVHTITETMKTLLHSTNTMLNVPRLKLHETLGRILPKPLARSLFLVSGSDAIEASIDLARKATGGLDVLGFHSGLHGSTSYLTRSLSFAWSRRKHTVVAPATSSIMTPNCYRCPLKLQQPSCQFACMKISLELADANFTSQPAAFIGEPILSAGGVIVPPPGYYKVLRRELEKRGMLMIFDESQTGLGKTGNLFGFQLHAGAQPDIMTLSKHFGGGLPISAVVTTDEIAERAVGNGYFATRSHATDPLLCAAGEESVKIVVEEDMSGKAKRIETRIKAALEEMAKEIDLIGDVRGHGVLLGIELVTDRDKKTPADAATEKVAQDCQDAGLIFQLRGYQGTKNIIRLVPPMTTTDEEVDRAMAILRDALLAAQAGVKAGAPAQAAD
ncbi:aspartate aminotransferase family protein [Allostella vacuolata]|nr:aspartate aminotransferase family protein [Stella vacuolata]